MSDGFKIQLQYSETLKDKGLALLGNIENSLNKFGLNVVNEAKRLAPVDEGHLRNSISFKLIKDDSKSYTVEFVVGVDYAAYIEFGTRGYAQKYVSSLPPDWQTYAATFKGKQDGSLSDMIDRLIEWVRRKGITGNYSTGVSKNKEGKFEAGGKKGQRVSLATGKNKATKKEVLNAENYSAAYVIALAILKKGIQPHPFLYPAFITYKDKIFDDFK